MNTVDVRNIAIGEGVPKICVPTIGKTKEELLPEVEVLKSVPVDVVEWHMDQFKEVECCGKAAAIPQMFRETMPEMPILVTFRSRKESEELEINITIYVELDKAITDSGNADLIDVKLFTGGAQVEKLVAHAHDKGVRIIISNHDFDKAPSYNGILIRLGVMQTLGVDIPEIVIIPTCKADVTIPLQAINGMHENFADCPIIIMSMVGTGVLSRLCGEVLGSALTFGTARKTSASGQMGVKDLKTVLSLLHKSL